MGLQINWSLQAEGAFHQEQLAMLGASLVLSWRGDVLVDASWQVSPSPELPSVSGLGLLVCDYLHQPDDTNLRLNLFKPSSHYRLTVWQALTQIPVGQVLSYSELALRLGSGPRAIANACRDNPYAGVIPCHRVVAKNGIGGFMGQVEGDFIALKRRLLIYEAHIAGGKPSLTEHSS